MGVQKRSNSQFTLLDILCMTIGFYAGIYIRHGELNIMNIYSVYAEVYMVLIITIIATAFFFRPYEDFFRRGKWEEFINVTKCLAVQLVAAILYMFVMQRASDYSRKAFAIAFAGMFLLTYAGRRIAKSSLWKFFEKIRTDCIIYTINRCLNK